MSKQITSQTPSKIYNKKIFLINLKNNKLEEYHITNNNIQKFYYSLYNGEYIVPHNFLLKLFNIKQNINIQEIKNYLSSIEEFIPLYNIYFDKLCVIPKNEVYDKIINKNFRFIDKNLIEYFINEYKVTKNKIKENIANYKYFKKLCNILFFISNFNIQILLNTFIRVFYFYSNELGKNLTSCIKPSFIPFRLIGKPYYTRSEIINFALNMGLIKESNEYYDVNKTNKLCYAITSRDFNIEVLITHILHIDKNNCKYLIKYFSLYGSYFMNKYLRNIDKEIIFKDELMEIFILKMWQVILTAPAFDKDYILYRFLSNDEFLHNINIGEIFSDPGFVSTTRNPFYDYKNNNFGFILLKIKVPKGIKGIGLCIENYSLFDHEEEIILPPYSLLRLDKITDNYNYYHPSITARKLIIKMYEFTLIGKNTIQLNLNYELPNLTNIIDPLTVSILDNEDDIFKKINYFNDTYVNEINQVYIKFNSKKYLFICNWYNSKETYNDFFYLKTNLGYIMYIQNEIGQIILSIEINEIISINYFQKFSDINNNIGISDTDLINIVSHVAYMFKVNTVIIHPYYNTCKIFPKNNDIERVIGDNYIVLHRTADLFSFCYDIYIYLKYKTIRLYNISGITSNFYYFQLDLLRTTDIDTIVYETDNDDLYVIYNNTYKTLHTDKSKHNICDFYIFIVENYFYKLNIFEYKMKRIFKNTTTNPFINKFYSFEPYSYLYENNFINDIPINTSINYNEHKYSINTIYQRIYNNEYREFRIKRKLE